MSTLTAVSSFDDVYQLETTDPVLGGAGGMANRQAQQLLNRTKYLADAIAAIDGSGGPYDFDASGGTPPTTGSGPGGAIKRKDLYVVTVAGTVSSIPLQVGDELIARIDNAAVIADFVILQGNAGLATPTVLGLVKLAQDLTLGSAVDVTLSLAGLISFFAKLSSPAFTGNPTTPDQTAGTNNGRIANTKYVDAAVGVEATARAAADAAEATARGAADTGLQNNINTEATTRSNADSTEATARAAADSAEAAARIAGDNAILTQPAWVNITLINGWTAGPRGAQYRVDNMGRVHFRGDINVAAATADIFCNSLPHPSAQVHFYIPYWNNPSGSAYFPPVNTLTCIGIDVAGVASTLSASFVTGTNSFNLDSLNYSIN